MHRVQLSGPYTRGQEGPYKAVRLGFIGAFDGTNGLAAYTNYCIDYIPVAEGRLYKSSPGKLI
jgi:hypothetical protein